MFKSLYFFYDINGNYRGKRVSYYYDDEPLVLKAEYCNATEFCLESSTVNGNRGSVPSIMIYRKCGPLKLDPYNEDGAPPTLMLSLAMPHVEFACGGVVIEGIEIPNLAWGGLLVRPYTDDYKPLVGVQYLTSEEDDQIHDTPFQLRKRQRIILK